LKISSFNVKSFLGYSQQALQFVSDSPHLESELLLSFVLGISREKLYLMADKKVPLYKGKRFLRAIEKRKHGYPFFYIYGRREFMGVEFAIREGVFIPRPETEILEEEALKIANGRRMKTLDIGSGSGCIILSFLAHNKYSYGIGLDISKTAIKISLLNAGRLNLGDRAQFINGDFFNYVFDRKFDLIMSNPPYVRSERIPSIKYEPYRALYGGSDGFDFYPDLFKKAFSLLNERGYFFAEIDEDMGERSINLMKKEGFENIKVIKDLSDMDRFVFGAKRP
jgi:release factor glutamine methyltransferase